MPSLASLLVVTAAVGLGTFSGCAPRELISVTAPPPPRSFSPAVAMEGAELAKIGNCAGCHTAPGGLPYAGGRLLETPFGSVYGTNITPDPETGIGRWSEAAFARAMREGLDRQGRHLYPAFPYDHFTHLADQDIRSLYAFLMTRDPVRKENKSGSIPIPRAAIALWNANFLDRAAFRPDPAHDAEWNRGAYLVDALGHCGACHSPHNALGAEKKREAFAGGEAEGWHAPALNAASPSPVPWTADALAEYLRHGIAENHAVSAGPMAEVVRNLAEAPGSDVRAMAIYLVSLDERSASRGTSRATPIEEPKEPSAVRGKAIYTMACADCHARGRDVDGGALPLNLAIALALPTPRNLAYIIRDGIIPVSGERGPWMPAFSAALDQEQLADLLVYLRSLSGNPEWKDVAATVRALDQEKK